MTMTAGQLAECAPGADKRLTQERLKHWLRIGLLRPIGIRKPGTGKHLRFPDTALIDVVILAALADIGMQLVAEKEQLRGALSRCQAEWRSWIRRRDKGEAGPLFLSLISVRNRRRGPTAETVFIGPAPKGPPGGSGSFVDLNHVFTQTQWPAELLAAVREEDSRR
jgi:hypothetical protein